MPIQRGQVQLLDRGPLLQAPQRLLHSRKFCIHTRSDRVDPLKTIALSRYLKSPMEELAIRMGA